MSNLNTKYLIIGTSAAGLAAALELRKLDPVAQITCLTSESEQPYNKCFLVDYLAGERTLDTVYLYSPEFLAQQKITILYSSTAAEIRTDTQEVQLTSGELITYNKLLIATGARAWVPPILGLNKLLEQELALNFYSLQDTLKLQTKLDSNKTIKHVTVIGAGLTGLECADALWRRGLKVTVIDQNIQVLSRVLDQVSAQFLQQKIIVSGIELILGAQILEITQENSSKIKLTLGSQAEIFTDLILLATGVQANSIKIVGGQLNLIKQQIQVDPYFKTNLPNIWAAGDAILVRDLVTGELRANRTWPDAILQGRLAARSMLAANFNSQEFKLSRSGINVSEISVPEQSVGSMVNLAPYTGQLTYYKSHIFNLDLVVCGDFNNLKKKKRATIPTEDSAWASYNYNSAQQLQGFVLLGDISQGAKLRRQIGI